MNLQDWKLLTELHKSNSISQTSETLFISQPALTRRLKQIEEEFSATILIRSSKGVTFTPQGELLVQYSQKMLKGYENLKLQMHHENALSSTLQIASSLSQTQFFLPGLLQAFSQLYPSICFEVKTSLSASCVKALNAHQIPVAFFRGDYDGNFEKVLLAAQEAYAVYCQPFEIEDLPSMPYISFESDHLSNSIRETWWYNIFDVPPYQAMSVKNGNAGYQMIAHGLGYGIFLGTDFWYHNKNLYAKKLYYKNKKPVIRNDWFGYRRDSLGLKQVASFVDFTIQYAQCKDLKQLNAGR